MCLGGGGGGGEVEINQWSCREHYRVLKGGGGEVSGSVFVLN